MAMNWKGPALLAAALVLLAAPHAHAQPVPTTVTVGRALSEQFCADCHVIAPSGRPGWTDAPAFDALANRADSTVARLSAFIQVPHSHMMNTGRPKDESDAIAAYILSLRQH